MKSVSILTAAMIVLAHGAIAASSHAADKPAPLIKEAKPVAPIVLKNLTCAVVTHAPTKPGAIQVATIRVTNTTGVVLQAGTRVHVNIHRVDGTWTTASFVLAKTLFKGASVDQIVFAPARRCQAQANIAAPKEPVPRRVVPR
jgi:hypothetical protein